ncbi:tubulin polyglutamylase TTLL5-like isoform X2 [Physella acuta]|uniref:tubulin polyglutamylase TTLL5-like isoform X2 n=1 Tax=Physella acuta TaxID=109671 RepID=UPI0027DC124A|nr:tubulin polyglutamylase TTLL5-like isoform X2 [Physella acuta]
MHFSKMELRKENDDNGGCISSMSPSENSERNFSSDQDSDYESDCARECYDIDGKPLQLRLLGRGSGVSVLEFDTDSFFHQDPDLKRAGEQHGLVCRISGNAQIVREILKSHGFLETHRNTRCFNLNWAANHPSPYYIRKMAHFQVINHFPQTKELTRKDKLFHNIIRMQKTYGKEQFDFVPKSFVIPNEYRAFRSSFKHDKGPYIIKPVGLSRGRGVSLITSSREALLKTESGKRNVVCKYITNPLILNGYKFDLRIYVAVTSFDPVVIYIYKEGLTRFATVKYNMHSGTFQNLCMHLTNYSINMMNDDYVKNIDPEVEDFGNKWSLGALLRYLRSLGKDTTEIMTQIEDVVIKTVLAAEWRIGIACKRYIQNRNNCFELFGFDILLDENYKAWLIEVNLSPSLGCDAPIDVKIKGNMLCDLLNLVGIRCFSATNYFRGFKEGKIRRKIKERLQITVGYYYYTKCRDAYEVIWGLRKARKDFKSLMQEEMNKRNLQPEKKNKTEKKKEEKKTKEKESESAKEKVSARENEKKRQKEKVIEKDKMKKGEKEKEKEGKERGKHKSKDLHTSNVLTLQEIDMIRRVREEELRSGGWLRIFPAPDTWDKYWQFLTFPTTSNKVLHQRLYPEMHSCMSAGKNAGAGMVTLSDKENELLYKMTGRKAEKDEKFSKAYIYTLQRMEKYETPLDKIPPQGFGIKSETDENEEMISEDFIKNLTHEVPHGDYEMAIHRDELRKHIFQQMENGVTLSETQARISLALYLAFARQRLIKPGGDTMDVTPEQLDLQDLLNRFLQQALLNIPCSPAPKKPSQSPPTNTELVAQRLANFINIYVKQTQRMIAENCPKMDTDQFEGIDPGKFRQFICSANEQDMEDLLTLYAQQNDAVEIFFGAP